MADFVLDGNDGKALHGGSVDVALDVVRGYVRDILRDFLLFLLGEGVFLDLPAPFLAELVYGLVEILCHPFVPSERRAHLVHLLAQLGVHHFLVDGQGVEAGLHEEEFGLHHGFQQLAADVAVRGHAAGGHHLDFLFYVGKGYEFTAYRGDGLVHYALILLGAGGKSGSGRQGRNAD